jgi:hypothetical protein
MPGQVMKADTGSCLKIVLCEAFLLKKLSEGIAMVPDLPVDLKVRRVDFGTENDLLVGVSIEKELKIGKVVKTRLFRVDALLKVKCRLAGPRTVRLEVEDLELAGVELRGLLDTIVDAFPGIVRTVGEQTYEYDIQYPFLKLVSLTSDGQHLVLFGDFLVPELMQFLKTLAPPAEPAPAS